MTGRPARVLSVAGLDPCGCSGLLADVRTFDSLGAFSTGVVTALTAQNTVEVTRIDVTPPASIAAQLEAVLTDVGADAIKIGMLGSPESADAVAEVLEGHAPLPLVVDPVLESSTGTRLFSNGDLLPALRRLLRRTTVMTPNLGELEELTGLPTATFAEQVAAARSLVDGFGASAVLVKGGHGDGNTIVDLLYDGERTRRFEHQRIATPDDRGTGCTLSSAIAVNLARALPLEMSVEQGIEVVQRALRGSLDLGAGPGPVYQLAKQRRSSDVG